MEQTLHIFNEIHDIEQTDDALNIAGYACIYGAPNANHQIVYSDSFKKFWNTYYANSNVMPALTYEHNQEQVIGRWDSVDLDDKKGMYVLGHISKGIKYNDEYIIPNVLKGNIRYLSTEGFVSKNEIEFVDEENFLIRDFRLTAISLVSVPACTEAELQYVNSLREATDEQVQEAVTEAKSKWYLFF